MLVATTLTDKKLFAAPLSVPAEETAPQLSEPLPSCVLAELEEMDAEGRDQLTLWLGEPPNTTRLVANRMLLATKSSYFSRAFRSGFRESGEAKLVLPHVRPRLMEAAIEHAARGGASLCAEDAAELFELACEFLMPSLQQDCEALLVRPAVGAPRIFEVAALAARHEAARLRAACVGYMVRHLPEVAGHVEFGAFAKEVAARVCELVAGVPTSDV